MDKAIYAIGNGEVMVYGCHDEWNEVIGPVYTSGSMFSLKRTEQTEWTSERKYASSVWTHVSEFGRLIDFASREYHCLVRKYEGSKMLTFKISFFDNEAFDNSVLFGDGIKAYILRRKEGSSAYERYVSREDKYLQILLRNGAYIDGDILYMPDGGEIVTVAKDGYDSLFAHAMEVKDIDSEKILASVKNEDDELFKRRMSRLPELRDHEMKDETLKAIDDVAMLIRAQQSVTGGVQAGHNYHLAYVRDEYGVFRGLLAMGM